LLAKAKQKIDRHNLRYFFSKQSFGEIQINLFFS